MGLIREEMAHGHLKATITVVEREEGEECDPWRIVGLDIDHFDRLTPPELRDLGRWLIKEGRRIGREYKSNGAPRAVRWPGGTT